MIITVNTPDNKSFKVNCIYSIKLDKNLVICFEEPDYAERAPNRRKPCISCYKCKKNIVTEITEDEKEVWVEFVGDKQ